MATEKEIEAIRRVLVGRVIITGDSTWDMSDVAEEVIEALDKFRDNYEPPDPPGWEGGFADNH